MRKHDELIEVVIHSAEYEDPTIPSEDAREQKWREINLSPKNDPLACEYCIRGIKDMENGLPIYCQCITGKQQRSKTPPLIAKIGENIVHFFRNLFSDKN